MKSHSLFLGAMTITVALAVAFPAQAGKGSASVCAGPCANLAVVVNAGNPASPDKGQISAIFLGRTKSFPGGARATPILPEYATPGLNEFLKGLVGRNTAQFRAGWSRLAFAGEAVPPQVLANSQAVANAVAGNREAIGIVDASVADPRLKVVARL